MEVWKSVGKQNLYGIAKTNFHQDKRPHRLPLDVGDSVIILRESGNWYYGYRKKNRAVKGIFPKSYVQVVLDVVIVKNEYVIRRSEIVDEITLILKEWHVLFKKFYLTNHTSLQNIREKMLELIRFRSQMLSGNLPVDEMKDIKLKATSEIDTGNKLLGLDMVVRDDNGNILDINATSTTQLYEQHVQATDRIRRATSNFNKNRTSKTLNKFSHNLLITVHNFVCKTVEDTELLFTLYDGEEMKAITENYLVRWSRQGIAKDLEQFNNLRGLFTDLSAQDLNRNKIYLVAYVVRIGAMDGKEVESRRTSVAVLSKRISNQSQMSSNLSLNEKDLMRRPFGVAAMDLTLIIKKAEDFKSDTQLQMPFVPCEKDSLDNTLRKLMSNKDIGKVDSNIWISVELLHGDLKQVKEEYPHLMLGNVALNVARKMGFPEVIFPGDVRNDLYVTLIGGEFSKQSKSSDKNIEVTVTVCNESGEIVPSVITQGGGAQMINEYRSVIYYHEDKPKWNETLKVNVPIEDFKQCHLKFMFKHRSSNDTKDKSEKPFAMSYVKLLQDNGTTLQHKNHQLIVYKIDHKKYDKETQFNYFSLPSRCYELGATPKPSVVGFTLLNKDSFVIETNLCSTKLTQDVDLLGLLNWTSHKETLEESLVQLMKVSPEEIVKFLQDILDALFNILVQNEDPLKYDNLVFSCLLMLIEIVSDKKYQHFQSVLDLYINESFSSTLAYDKLINVLERHFLNAFNNVDSDSDPTILHDKNDKPSEKKLYKTIKNLQYIMKFIIRSRILFANLNDDRDKFMFETRLEDLLGLFIQLISMQNDLLRSQGAILKYLHVIASDLMQVYDPLKLSNFIVDMISNIPQGRLNQSKMTCIKDLVDSKLFRLPLCRGILLPNFCRQIKDKLESKEEGDNMSDIWQQEKNLTKAAKVLGESKSQLHTRETPGKTKVAECVNIMNNMLEMLFSKEIGPTENDIRDIMLCLLRTVIQSSIAMDRDNPLVGNLVAIMLAIFRNMTEFHYKIYVNHFHTRFDLQDFLTEILLVFKELVSRPVFPADWLDMMMHQNTVILESLRHFARIIMEKFFDPFEKQVWTNFFHCSIAFLIQPALQLDQFSRNKKSMILTRYHDIRRETAYEIRSMWFNLGEHKVQFVPALVGSLLEMSMIPETELRKATIPIFFDMMQCEYYSSKLHFESYGDTKRNNATSKMNFSDFEKEMIEKLDILIEGGRGDHEYKDLFNQIMMEHCQNHNSLQNDGTNFVNMATKLMERLLEYRFLINDESKENRMACTVSLLQFYSEVNRKEMYIRYVNKLCDLHMEFDNYTEAAFTLKLHSNLLHWNETNLSPLLRSHRHPHFVTHRQLKEQLYKDIVSHFDNGKMWECALDLCKELAQQYENEIFDYMSLSELYGSMSHLYRKILTEMRHESEYFRVAFFGLGFPEFLRNRTFIYRGKEYERLSSFCTRILSQHPRAELMQTLTPPGAEITNSDAQYIQINSVEPIVNERNRRFQNLAQDKNIAQAIVKYYKTNNVDEFKFSRPYRDKSKNSGVTDDPDSVGNLWLERTVMKTEFPLPGILRWFPVERSETSKITPIEYAIETMESTNKIIRELVIEHKSDPSLGINALSMKINGIVDPAVMGGFSKYEDAFLTQEYLILNPDDDKCVEKLQNLIAEQIPILELAIGVHRMKAPPSLMPFQDRLEKCFAEMQLNVETRYGKRSTDLKFERESVQLRKSFASTQMSFDANRLSETSMGSSDSGFHGKSQSRQQIMSTVSNLLNFNTPNLTRTSMGTSPSSKKPIKEKGPTPGKEKRRPSRKMDRDTLSLPLAANSQWYTGASSSISTMLSPIAATPTDKENTSMYSFTSGSQTAPVAPNATTPVFELTEELTPKRPLRSEAEKEKRLSRPPSMAVSTTSVPPPTKTDNVSVSGESSNSRNSIITTDSQTSEEDTVPPPLPLKHRDSDYGNLPEEGQYSSLRSNKSYCSNKPLPPVPAVSNSHYETVEARNHEIFFVNDVKQARRPPTPPPKPLRNTKQTMSP